jgi:cell wall-associated NlpC family hydrolase
MAPGRRPAPARARLVAVAGAVLFALVAPPGVASAEPKPPTDEQMTQAQQARDAAVQQLAELSTRLVQAQAQVDAANAAADIALDAYQAKQAEYEAAQVTAESTATAAQWAAADLASSRADVAAFARESYIQGTTSPGLQAMLDIDDPAQMLERARLLAAAGGYKSDVLVQFALAHRRAVAADDAAHNAVVQAGVLEQQAADALHAAEAVQATAQQQAADFAAEQVDLGLKLQQAQQALAALEGQRAAALEYQRQQAAAQAAAEAARQQQVAAQAAADAAAAPVGPGSASAAATAISTAVDTVGTPYAWGGGSTAGPSLGFGIDAGVVGYDCSALTRYAYAQAGISLPRNSRAQYAALPKVARADLQPGDLVFWAMDVNDPATIHHVALYLGSGKIVEAPHSGATVHVTSMYWSGYIGAVRPTA